MGHPAWLPKGFLHASVAERDGSGPVPGYGALVEHHYRSIRVGDRPENGVGAGDARGWSGALVLYEGNGLESNGVANVLDHQAERRVGAARGIPSEGAVGSGVESVVGGATHVDIRVAHQGCQAVGASIVRKRHHYFYILGIFRPADGLGKRPDAVTGGTRDLDRP